MIRVRAGWWIDASLIQQLRQIEGRYELTTAGKTERLSKAEGEALDEALMAHFSGYYHEFYASQFDQDPPVDIQTGNQPKNLNDLRKSSTIKPKRKYTKRK